MNYAIPRAFSLAKPCSNNVAEYNALLIRMQIADEIGVKNLEAYGDSKLIVNQVCGEYEVRHEDLVPYYNATICMAERFRNFFIDHIPRQQNAHADALASLAASLALPTGVVEKILVYSHDLYCLRFVFEDHQKPTGDCQVKEALETSTGPELKDWRFSYIDYALYGICPEDPKEAAAIRRKAPKSTIMRSREHYTADRIMGSSSTACHRRRHMKYSKKRMTACMELTSLARSLGIDSEE